MKAGAVEFLTSHSATRIYSTLFASHWNETVADVKRRKKWRTFKSVSTR